MVSADKKEYGKTDIDVHDVPIFAGISQKSPVWMSHGDSILSIPEGFKTIASSSSTPSCAIMDEKR